MKRTAALLLCVIVVLTSAVSALGASAYTYRSKLSQAEMEIYNAIEKEITALNPNISFTFSDAPTYASSTVGDTAVQNMIFRAFEAFYRDRPEVFWVNKNGITGGAALTPEGGQFKAVGGTLTVVFNDAARIAQKRQTLESATGAIVSSATGSDYNKVRAFHNAIVTKCSYDTAAKNAPASNPDAYESYGALVDGRAVCEGYSKAMKLLCDRAGIPCVIVGGSAGGEGHMWNYIAIDGTYYLVDATFNDPIGAEPTENYFLKGSDSTPEHRAFGGFIEGFDAKLSNPPLSKTDYQPSELDSTADAFSGDVIAIPDITPAAKSSKARCTVDYDNAVSGGRFVVRYIGDFGALDPGQEVPNGMTVEVSAQPAAGYKMKEISVSMGEGTLLEKGKTTYYFTVIDDCEVSVSFERAA